MSMENTQEKPTTHGESGLPLCGTVQGKAPIMGRYLCTILVILVACETAKALLFAANGQAPLSRDALQYWRLGEQIASGDVFLVRNAEASRPPAYPMFLAVCQALFKDHALIVSIWMQQAFYIAVTLATAWMCKKVTGSPIGVVLGLLLPVACISRNVLGQFALSDNLLCLFVTMYGVSVFYWSERPSFVRAALMGASIALAILARPVAQLLWVPSLLIMGIRLKELGAPIRLCGQGMVMVVTMGVLLLPWYIRNEICFGQPFLTKFSGRALWWAMFENPPGLHPMVAGMQFGEGPSTDQVSRVSNGLERHTWPVYENLRKAGYSEIESDDLMYSVCKEAIRKWPKQFVLTRVGFFLMYWVTPPEPEWWTQEGLEEEDWSRARDDGTSYEGQRTWSVAVLARSHNFLMRCLWHPSRNLYVCGFVLVIACWLAMLFDKRFRTHGIVLGLIMAYFASVSAIMIAPAYRYRIMLEPLMIVVVAAGSLSLMERVGISPRIGSTPD